MRLRAEWTDDCCGKKDYDGNILSVSTRYWPRGGSSYVLDRAKPELGFLRFDDGSKPSAHSSLFLHGCGECVTLVDKDFEGETFAEVAAQVEAWVQEQMDKAEAALRGAFKQNEKAEG